VEGRKWCGKKHTEEERRTRKKGDKYLLGGRRWNSLTDNFTLAVYMQFLVAADNHIRVLKTLKLSAEPESLRTSFYSLTSVTELAALLECSLQQFIYWTRIARPQDRYRAFEIAKRSGAKRSIEAPSPVLLVLQRKLLQVLEAVYEPRAPVHGFVRARSVLTNASLHVRRAWVLNIDLADFFPSIHFGRVRGIFRAKPFLLPDPVAIAIAQLTCSQGRLPQGAPTSPIISNIICAKMDGELRRFASEQGAVYTRYADDIVRHEARTVHGA
jgi:RNA-directed DNA polymerase